jgi:hypothetical protein
VTRCLFDNEKSCSSPVKIATNKLFNTEVYHCPSCNVVFNSPVPSEEQLANYYTTRDNSTYARRLKRYARAIGQYEYLRSHIQPTESFAALDFGCCFGSLVEIMNDHHLPTIGIEPNTACRERCNRKVRHRIYAGLGSLQGQEFTLIILSHVLEHLPDPVGTLIQLKSRVRPLGHIMIEVPLLTAEGLSSGKFTGEHITMFSPESIEKLAETAGLILLPGLTEFYGRREKPPHIPRQLRMLISPRFAARHLVKRRAQTDIASSSLMRVLLQNGT